MTDEIQDVIAPKRGRPAKAVDDIAPSPFQSFEVVAAPVVIGHLNTHPAVTKVCEKLRCTAQQDENPAVYIISQFSGAQLCINIENFKDGSGEVIPELIEMRLLASGFIG